MSLSREEVFECIQTGRKKAITMLAMRVAKLQISLGEPISGVSDEVNELVMHLAKTETEYVKKKCKESLYLFTVRPADNIPIEALINATLKFCERVYMTPERYIVRFEQKGEVEGDWRGRHVHILLNGEWRNPKKKSKQEYIRDLHRTYSQYMEIKKQYCDVKVYMQGKLPTLLNYLNGNKQDPAKLKAAELDKIWRASVDNEYIHGWGDLHLV